MDAEEADDGMERFVDAPDPIDKAEAVLEASSARPLPSTGSAEQPGKSKSSKQTDGDATAAKADGPSSSDGQPPIGGYDMRKR